MHEYFVILLTFFQLSIEGYLVVLENEIVHVLKVASLAHSIHIHIYQTKAWLKSIITVTIVY